jgi:hypothetical protein
VPAALLGSQAPAARHPSGEPGAIFLAEGTPDLRIWRDLLRRQLIQCGLGVRPETVYPAAPADYAQAVGADLARCLLFVQVLGPYSSDKRLDLPQGYEGLQLELAQSVGLPILRWCDPAVDLAKVDDPGLFARAEVIVAGFDDFKRQVETEARRRLLPAPTRPAGDTQVLIRATGADESAALELGDRLYERHAIGYELADEGDDLSDLVAANRYQGLVVVYERCDRDWAKRQIQECRVIAMEGKDRAPACAVLDSPKPDKPRLGIRVPRFFFLPGLDAPEMGQFVAALAAPAP